MIISLFLKKGLLKHLYIFRSHLKLLYYNFIKKMCPQLKYGILYSV